MSRYECIEIVSSGAQARCLLNRPERRNAINPLMIRELTDFFIREVPASGFRSVQLRGNGGFFCAGADLAWMKESAGYSQDQNLLDAKALFDMFDAIDAIRANLNIMQQYSVALSFFSGLFVCGNRIEIS